MDFSTHEWWYVNITIKFDNGLLQTRAQYCKIKDDCLQLHRYDVHVTDLTITLDSIQSISITWMSKTILSKTLHRPTLQTLELWRRE